MKAIKYILIFLASLIISCSSSDDGTLDYYTISEEFKSYAFFKSGSKWIYEEEKTGNQATIKIDSILNYIGVNGLDPDNDVEFRYDAWEMFIHEPNDLNYAKLEIAATNQPKIASDMTSLLRLFTTAGYHTIFQPCFPFGDTIALGDVAGDLINVEFLTSYKVKDISFSSVFHSCILVGSGTGMESKYDFYIARNFGIIRQEKQTASDTTIWNLTSWDLIQE